MNHNTYADWNLIRERIRSSPKQSSTFQMEVLLFLGHPDKTEANLKK